jgi:DNA-binding NarL/FixJ family response regulator
MTARALKVVVADDARPARKFLPGLLKTCDGVQLVGEPDSGEEAISIVEAERPHLGLLDLQMPQPHSIPSCEKLF